ncbi:transmembrane channel-like protein 5 isoform X1 [Leucoraja erinacea]|uniref:transmembrane channel-like protein 5 isoform X1 n=1 Tax=Leucoraja erinaceus TaxID=7782 RepID=UPI00245388CD|nr:transmembrane channel-like protein 5 isoform X1 [Leucoraja erinacea]XP_055506925.1 transmembrane channel-like protein 5 isoform X1 [Leucoraja erinacea]
MSQQEENECFENYAYHHSETLEMDRGTRGPSTAHATPLPSSYQRDVFQSSDVWRNCGQPEIIQMTTIGREHRESTPPFNHMNANENNTGYVNPGFEPIADDSYGSVSSTYSASHCQDSSFIPSLDRHVQILNMEPKTYPDYKYIETHKPPQDVPQTPGKIEEDASTKISSQLTINIDEITVSNLNKHDEPHWRGKRRISIGAVIRMASLVGVNELDRIPERELREEETEERKELIAELVTLSSSERARAILELTVGLDEKRKIREQVNMEIGPKSMEREYQINSCTQLLAKILSTLRRFRENAIEIFHSIHPLHRSLKVIGGKFGTGVLTYFTFLKWLLSFNILTFLINTSFITIPQFFDLVPNNRSFTGLELLSGAGYFTHTVFYYGVYTNASIHAGHAAGVYNMQLAYFLTFGVCMLMCFLSLVFSMAKSFNENFIAIGTFSGEAAKLLCSWDYNITNEKTVQLKKRSLSTQLKEMLSHKMHYKRQLTRNQRIVRYLIHLMTWIISLGTTYACCFGVYSYSVSNFQVIEKNAMEEDLQKQAITLILPCLVSSINLFVPLFFSFLGLMERFKYPWHEIYVLIIRNVLLKMSMIGVLSYYWLVTIANNMECWETFVGQELYRLVVTDFIFSLFSSFFGEFIRSVIGTHCCPKLGKPEFDIARNVLSLIYAQTLGWIGIFFAPLLPAIQIIKFFMTFHVKKVSLMMNCQPPRMAWQASHMTTIFILLLFFPAFIGVLCLIGVIVWKLRPSKFCGPFRGLITAYSAVSHFINEKVTRLEWLSWVYKNMVLSPLFYFTLSIIVFAFIYLYWQIIDGRKVMVKLLQGQIINEGKDKAYLLQKLTALRIKEDNGGRMKSITFAKEPDQQSGGGSESQFNKQRFVDDATSTSDMEVWSVISEKDQDRGSSIIESGSAQTLALAATQQVEQEQPQ